MFTNAQNVKKRTAMEIYRLHMKRLTFHIEQISGKTSPTVIVGLFI